jgi:hypothetical protein
MSNGAGFLPAVFNCHVLTATVVVTVNSLNIGEEEDEEKQI